MPDRRIDVVAAVVHGVYGGVARATADFVAKALEPSRRQIAALEPRVQALEQRPAVGVEWAGIYSPEKQYQPGQLCTRSGALWLALRQTTGATPGRSPEDWRLILKRGDVPQED